MKFPLHVVHSFGSFSRHGSFGFGFGIWRTYLGVGQKPIWTIAVGPLSIYVRKLYASERG